MAEHTVFDRINDYGSVRITLASPNDIRSWSFGEVKKPETINYRTYRAEKDGLFCERIFGPERDWECACGKYKGTKHKGMICDRCGVKVTHSRVRRKRMGHINLAAPIVHIWFFKAMPSRLGCLLGLKTTDLEKIVYFQDYVVIDPKDAPGLKEKQLLTEEEYRDRVAKGQEFEAEMGAEAIKKLLTKLDLAEVAAELRDGLTKTNSKQKIKDITKRLKIVEQLRNSDNQPVWMVMDVVPVIPPDLRPLVLLESGNFATSDLNDLYRRIINRNNRLKKLVDLNAPEVIIRNEKRMLQQAVDALFDNGRCRRPVLGSSNRPLKSLTDMIKGKQGRFRENLLGKRVDYSARSVIVVGPELQLHQCGLPKKIALELYQPFIIRKLKERNLADTIKSAKRMLERQEEAVWDILEEVIHQHPVMLNRAPTLHRMGIQAFEPVLVEGNAIKIHPLVCKGFNADFDGDQMAVHLPLSIEAQVEVSTLMMATSNIFSPAHGGPIISPSQDIVLGIYWLTLQHDEEPVEHPPTFRDAHEAMMAHGMDKITMHASILVRMPEGVAIRTRKGRRHVEVISDGNAPVTTTVGRLIFNDILPEGMPFYNFLLDDGGVNRVISDAHRLIGRKATIAVLDGVKELGFKHSALAGLSFSASDLRIPANKEKTINATQKEVDKIEKQRTAGIITEGERYNQIIDRWTHAREDVAEQMMVQLANDYRDETGRPAQAGKGKLYLNPIYLMADSGARGSKDQIRQLAGMRGLMAKPSGKIIETPIKANFREGLSVLEYFSSTHGARKGLADTALKTADSGYLTRKLADVAQNVIITENNCGTLSGVRKSTVYEGQEVKVPLSASIIGRTARDTILNPITNKVIVKENETITELRAHAIEDLGIDTIRVRSALTCESPLGICARCYGVDLSSGRLVEEGTAVGIIAAQSIGEPGTQLTMRTFHIGGVHAGSVAVSELVASRAGTVEYRDLTQVAVEDEAGKRTIVLKRNGDVAILDPKGRELETHRVPYGAELLVKEGQSVKKGQKLAKWDPFRVPILAEAAGIVRYQDVVEGETMRIETESKSEKASRLIIEHKGDLHPQIVIEDKEGKIVELHYLPARAYVDVEEGDKVMPGSLLARQAREMTRQSDITGGLPRVTEIFEARQPKEPSVMAEISGQVDIRSDKRRGKMTIVVKNEQTGMEKEHHVAHGKRLLVHAGDEVNAGDPLVAGPLVPHDILRIRGEEALQEYLLGEIQNVYRSQNVKINDKHVEIILSQMLRKVQLEQVGDSSFLPGDVVDKFKFRAGNEVLSKSVRISDPGDTDLKENQIVPKAELAEINAEVEEGGGEPAKGKRPKQAMAKTLLLGITKASLQSESFLAAASFQETTKVLTEAALAGKMDPLLGLKENIILGHLVPAGTAFKPHLDMVTKRMVELSPEPQESEEELMAEAKEAMAAEVAD